MIRTILRKFSMLALLLLFKVTGAQAINFEPCAATILDIGHKTVEAGKQLRFYLPVQELVGGSNCAFDYQLTLQNAPSGMHVSGKKRLLWTPNESQIGHYRVGVEMVVNHTLPVVKSVRFYKEFTVTVTDCSSVEVRADWAQSPYCSTQTTGVAFKTFLSNLSACTVTLSGYGSIDNTEQGTFNNLTLAPGQQVKYFEHFYPNHGDGVLHGFKVKITSANRQLIKTNFYEDWKNEGWEYGCN